MDVICTPAWLKVRVGVRLGTGLGLGACFDLWSGLGLGLGLGLGRARSILGAWPEASLAHGPGPSLESKALAQLSPSPEPKLPSGSRRQPLRARGALPFAGPLGCRAERRLLGPMLGPSSVGPERQPPTLRVGPTPHPRPDPHPHPHPHQVGASALVAARGGKLRKALANDISSLFAKQHKLLAQQQLTR